MLSGMKVGAKRASGRKANGTKDDEMIIGVVAKKVAVGSAEICAVMGTGTNAEKVEANAAKCVQDALKSAKNEAKVAVGEHASLQAEIFPDFKLGLVHVRLKAEDKDKVMSAFRSGEFNILVSTSVVEVGIDVPNATVMMVEGANRFGLSQLHQFRGRVGRGEHQSYCILLSETAISTSMERLRVIAETHNGFLLAEEDLRLRGPGGFFGTRRGGGVDLRLARPRHTDPPGPPRLPSGPGGQAPDVG